MPWANTLGSSIIVNLFIGVVLNGILQAQATEKAATPSLHDELIQIQQQLQGLKEHLRNAEKGPGA